MRQKIDINEVELRTKIRAKYLRAMENEEWDLLPGEVYVRSFLRTYGDFLGLDSRALLDDFRRRYESPTDHEPPPIVPPSRERRGRERTARPRRGVPSWAIVGVVIAVVVVVLYLVGTGGNNSTHDHSVPHTTATHVARHHVRAHRGAGNPASARKQPAKKKTVTLTLVPTGEVYVCLVNGAGKALIAGRIYDTGETIPTETAGKLLLTLGNASMTVKADGDTVPVTDSAEAIRLEFTPAGHMTIPASTPPTCV